MVFAVDQMHFEIDDREADQRIRSRRSRAGPSQPMEYIPWDVAALISSKNWSRSAAAGITLILISPNAGAADCFLWV